MCCRLGERQHRYDAGVTVFEFARPLIARARAEDRGEALLQPGPGAGIHLCRKRVIGEAQPVEELFVELRLQGADCHVTAVAGCVDAVERGAAVEQVAATCTAPPSGGAEREYHRSEEGGAFDHRGIDDLAAAGPLRVDDRAQNTERVQETAPAHVADEVQRRQWRFVVAPEQAEHAR